MDAPVTNEKEQRVTMNIIRRFLGHGEGTRRVRIPNGKDSGNGVIECCGSINPEKHTPEHDRWRPVGNVAELTRTIRAAMAQAQRYSTGTRGHSPVQTGPYIYIMAYRRDLNAWWTITKEELSDRMTGSPKDRMMALKQLEYFGSTSTQTAFYRCYERSQQDMKPERP